VLQAARDPYGYMLSALQLQKLYIDRNVATDKLASVTVVADKRCDEWRRLVTPAAGAQCRCVVVCDVAISMLLQCWSFRPQSRLHARDWA
jgi:hypothetical protein